jgi:hypothetical protein
MIKLTNNHLRFFTFLIIGLLVSAITDGQVLQPNRFEREQKNTDNDFTIISLKTEGLAIVCEQNKYKAGNQKWEVILLDTILNQTGVVEVEVDFENKFIGYDYTQGFVHLLFSVNELQGKFEFLSIDIKSHEVTRYETNAELRLQLTHFSKVGESFALGGYVNLEPTVLLYTTTTKSLKVLPGFFQKNTELIDLRTNQNQTFNVVLIDRADRENRKIIFRTFDSSGKQLIEDITDIEEDIVLQNGISSTLEREDLIVIGTWGKRNTKQSTGFYFFPVNPFTEQKINRLYFGQLEHYLDYLKPKRAAKVKSKSLKAIEEGKLPDFTNFIVPYKIVEHSKGFLLLAESYAASNTSNQNQNYNPNNNYYYSPYGYYPSNRISNPNYSYGNNVPTENEFIKTIQTVAVSFDANGQVMWDQSMKLTEFKMPSLQQVTEVQISGDSVLFLYKKESELKIKTIRLDAKESYDTSQKIQLSQSEDELRSEDQQEGVIKHWFGKNFYVWGNQSIRNKTKSGNKTRDVFYINKVAIR